MRSLSTAQSQGQAPGVLQDLRNRLAAGPDMVLRAALETQALEALAVAAVKHPGAYQKLLLDLRGAGAKVKDIDALKQAVKGQRQLHVVTPENTEPAKAGDTLPDAPLPDQVIPSPYFLEPDATGHYTQTKSGTEPVVIAPAPILLSGMLRDAEEGTTHLRLSWSRPGGNWQCCVEDRGVVLNSRKLVDLASKDFPVSSANAADVVKYLQELEAANRTLLPCLRVSSHLGWQDKDGRDGFLWGHSLIPPDGGPPLKTKIEELEPKDWRAGHIAFRGLAVGDEQIARGYYAAGNRDEWLQAIRRLENYPHVLITLYAAFVPPLLVMLQAPNFILDLSGRTTTGKTISQRIAASVWGCPDERAAAAAIGSWDSTRVALERGAAVLHDLPLILDDTKRAKAERLVSDTLYQVANGRGRARGNPKGLDPTKTWRTVLISSGEAPATSFTQDGGTRTRVLEVRGLPFSGAGEKERKLVTELDLAVKANYGHAGPEFIRYLVKNRDKWDYLPDIYQEAVARYSSAASTPEGGRLAHYIAAIDVAAEFVNAVFDFNWNPRDRLEALWPQIAGEAEDAAGAERALEEVLAWANSNADSFHQGPVRVGSPRAPARRWSGRWDRANEAWEAINFYPHVVKGILTEFGFSPAEILFAWRERGWLITRSDKKRRYTRQFRIDGRPVEVISIARKAIEEVMA